MGFWDRLFGREAGTVKVAEGTWRLCEKCFGLWHSGSGKNGVCPAGGAHSAGSDKYRLGTNRQPGHEHDWRRCHKCMGLYYDGNGARGICAFGGAHEFADGENYVLQFDDVPDTRLGTAQVNWRCCPQCQGLFHSRYESGTANGVCPARRGMSGDTQHGRRRGYSYTLYIQK